MEPFENTIVFEMLLRYKIDKITFVFSKIINKTKAMSDEEHI
jgi:hypothetical protein